MNRSDCLKLLALATSVCAFPAISIARTNRRIAIYDGRFAEARAFARTMGQAHDCRHDAASLWFGQFSGKLDPGAALIGLTSAADAMVLADCARREGLVFAHAHRSGHGGQLIGWTISRRAL